MHLSITNQDRSTLPALGFMIALLAVSACSSDNDSIANTDSAITDPTEITDMTNEGLSDEDTNSDDISDADTNNEELSDEDPDNEDLTDEDTADSIYESAPETPLEVAAWLRTGALGAEGEENQGGWACYANTNVSEVGWAGLYFNGNIDETVGQALPATTRTFFISVPSDFTIIDVKTIEFADGFIWSDLRFLTGFLNPMFNGEDSRGFRVDCSKSPGVPIYY